ncbi:TRAP transporter substrate-binding protein [Billgrantia saliphila]|uniref:TRAP transporter substrate-binding protein n=1 Tax=Billgrantia saliphila TaxID=1848458 RepID=UPI0018CC5953|nr:TRAP transporter substrate-binding protein [Halomonas saliphila]
MKMIKTAFVTTALALSLTPGLGMAQTELQFGHVGNPGSLFDASANEFAERANERLGDDYRVEVYGSSQLGGDDSMMQKLKLGQLTFTLPSTVMSSVVDEFGLFEMPYLIKDREHMKRVIDEVIESDLYPLVEEEGYKILAVWENGFRQITNNERPIQTPEDLEGLKLRTPKGAWRVRMFEEYGANPSPMALSEVFTALQTGTMDGQENPLVQIHSQKFQEVQDYLSMTNHVYTPAYVVVSKRHWEDLPEDVRNILEETAQEVQDFVYETAARQDEELLGEMEAAGMEINEADQQAFIDASGPIYERFDEEVEGGGDLVDRVLALGEDD